MKRFASITAVAALALTACGSNEGDVEACERFGAADTLLTQALERRDAERVHEADLQIAASIEPALRRAEDNDLIDRLKAVERTAGTLQYLYTDEEKFNYFFSLASVSDYCSETYGVEWYRLEE